MPEEPDYDAAATEDDEMEDMGDGEEELDTVFLDHAMDAGMNESQARALKKAIERCNELKDQGAYEDMGAMLEGDDAEI